MGFIQKISQSITSSEFYQSIPGRSLGGAIGYFLLFTLLLSLLQMLTSIPVVTEIQKGAPQIVDGVVDRYPNELEVYIKDGKASTNVKEPYFIPFDLGEDGESPKNFLVIDTKTPYSSTQFHDYDTIAWLTEDSVFYQKNDNEISTFDLSQANEDITINKSLVRTIAEHVYPYLKYITPFLLAAFLFGFYMVYSFRLIYLFFFAFVLWIFSKILHKPLTYGNSYKMGLYALTLPLIIEFALGVLTPWIAFAGFPFMVTLIALGVVYFNYFRTPPTT